jgi:hypothetical protein
MPTAVGDYGRYPASTGKQSTVRRKARVDIGASGAATVNANSDPGFTCVKNTTGVYDVTFPKCPAAGNPTIRAYVQLSAASTVSQANFIAVDFQAGTGQFKSALNTAGTGVEPASGDIIVIELDTGISAVA